MSTEGDQRTARIAALALTNAMIFQEVLSASDHRVHSLRLALQEPNFASALTNEWKMIIDKIDYVPIFKIGHELLINLSSSPELDRSLRQLANVALNITTKRAALRHDLMGRIYHLLLSDAKYFGAFYTMIPSATMLLNLTFASDGWNLDWSDLNQVSNLRIADLACGTGTLLKATLESIIDNYVIACAGLAKSVNLRQLHRVLVENVLVGLDVLPFAVHLAATTLALHSPEIPFKNLQLYSLPLGAPAPDSVRLGSIDLFRRRQVVVQSDLFGGIQGPERVAESGDVSQALQLRDLDLCVMNPPFTRSVGGNLLFGSAPEEERRRMQVELQDLVRSEKIPANITAGLGAVFVALGDYLLKKDGHMSLVLPRSLLSGITWEETRQLLENKYEVRYVVVSHETDNWNFSENTDLGETLIVAQKGKYNKQPRTMFVNLWRRPRNTVEALACSNLILDSKPADIEAVSGTSELLSGLTKFGEALQAPTNSWSRACAFAQTDLNRTAYNLARKELIIPGSSRRFPVPLTTLKTIGEVGPDRRDIFDGFAVSNHFTPYPALWGYDSGSMRSLSLRTNKFLAPLSKPRPGRHLRRAEDLWPRAGSLMITERIRLNKYPVVAALVGKPALSNVWWPVRLKGKAQTKWGKALAVWINSTLGMILVLAYRGDTEGAWIQLKKPTLENLPVLNLTKIRAQKLTRLSSFYDLIAKESLLPISECEKDPIRSRIDDEIQRALNLPDISPLRQALSHEPITSLKPL